MVTIESALGTFKMELDYMQRLKWWIRCVDAWPAKDLGEKVPSMCRPIHYRIIIFFSASYLLAQLGYIQKNQGIIPLFQLGHCYVTLLMNGICLQRLTLILTKPYRMVTKTFVKEMHLFHHRHLSDYATKTYEEVNKYCRLATTILQLQTIGCPVLFNLMPIFTNISSGMYSLSGNRPVNGTYQHSIYYILPYESDTFTYYLILATINFICCGWVGISFCTFDLYLTILVCHIWGHLKILEYHLRNFIRPSTEQQALYLPMESEVAAPRLKMLINHHNQILQFVNDCTEAFGPTLALYFTFHQICCCILLLECSKLDTESLVEFGPLTLMTFQSLIQISVIFEFIGAKSEGLMDAIYSLPWEDMQVRERRMVLFFLRKAQTPIHFKAMGLVPVGVNTMAAIIKTSLSYFVLLRTAAT